ncbi:phage terminase large subunit [Allobaculum sp. Allo2]|uniref:phage terminase large subunit n=1 Tax=Allobaculum sp. Allo2 TaxID=2853432 RepID=UPI002111D358|nr:phage terminase large subunit [Allobaculum sp. Allo2]UNT92624.1 phage terminase large subunit [Allobaculum sp. Allo2]
MSIIGSKAIFDAPESENILALTTNYLCNEWLDDDDLQLLEDMKKRNPRRYEVAGLGNWGIVDGLVYENFHIRDFEITDIGDAVTVSGLDFGFTNDPTAFSWASLTRQIENSGCGMRSTKRA